MKDFSDQDNLDLNSIFEIMEEDEESGTTIVYIYLVSSPKIVLKINFISRFQQYNVNPGTSRWN